MKETPIEPKQKLTKSQKKALARQKRIDFRKENANQKRKEKRVRDHAHREEILQEMGIADDTDKRDAYFKELKIKKEEMKNRVEQALNDKYNSKLIIDCSFGEHMGLVEKKSLAFQAQIINGDQKKIPEEPDYSMPFGVHVVNLNDPDTVKCFQTLNADKWKCHLSDKNLKDTFGPDEIDWNNTVYLSPDGPDVLFDFDIEDSRESFQSDTRKFSTSFIIGGLIDRTIVKNATLNQFQNLKIDGLQCKRLPIAEYFDTQNDNMIANRKELSLDLVVRILSRFKQLKLNHPEFTAPEIWRKVLMEAIPLRTIKQK